MRKHATDAERKLWAYIGNAKLGIKFRRQQPMGAYILDFYSAEKRLAIELDGGQHSEKIAYDTKRTVWLEAQGITVLRFWNNEVLRNVEGVIAKIIDVLKLLPPPALLRNARPPARGGQRDGEGKQS